MLSWYCDTFLCIWKSIHVKCIIAQYPWFLTEQFSYFWRCDLLIDMDLDVMRLHILKCFTSKIVLFHLAIHFLVCFKNKNCVVTRSIVLALLVLLDSTTTQWLLPHIYKKSGSIVSSILLSSWYVSLDLGVIWLLWEHPPLYIKPHRHVVFFSPVGDRSAFL